MRPTLSCAIVAYLRDGPRQSMQIVSAMSRLAEFREVDRELQRLRRAGVIETLPRIRGERPFPLWQLRSAEGTTPPNSPSLLLRLEAFHKAWREK